MTPSSLRTTAWENRNPQPQGAWTVEPGRHIQVRGSHFSMEKKGGRASLAQAWEPTPSSTPGSMREGWPGVWKDIRNPGNYGAEREVGRELCVWLLLRPLPGWGSQQLPTAALASAGRSLLVPQAHAELVRDAGNPSCGLAARSGDPPDPVQDDFPNRDLTRGLNSGCSGFDCLVPQPTALTTVFPPPSLRACHCTRPQGSSEGTQKP